jgi:hypothetical protein
MTNHERVKDWIWEMRTKVTYVWERRTKVTYAWEMRTKVTYAWERRTVVLLIFKIIRKRQKSRSTYNKDRHMDHISLS